MSKVFDRSLHLARKRTVLGGKKQILGANEMRRRWAEYGAGVEYGVVLLVVFLGLSWRNLRVSIIHNYCLVRINIDDYSRSLGVDSKEKKSRWF